MQHLLCRAVWSADGVRDDVREYVVEHLYDDAAVLVVDETGDVKKGTHTVEVQRQNIGTAGRIENSQLAVFPVYAGERGHATVDRELYIPRSWTCDPERCRQPDSAQTPSSRPSQTWPARWPNGSWTPDTTPAGSPGTSFYGGNPRLRTALQERGIGYVLAVACSAW